MVTYISELVNNTGVEVIVVFHALQDIVKTPQQEKEKLVFIPVADPTDAQVPELTLQL